MTYVELDRRVGKLEKRVDDIESTMPKDIRGVRLYATRSGTELTVGVNRILAHMGLEPIEDVRYPTDGEIEASFEADC
ncbi:hypothetical protein [Nocardia sp. NPDC051832]|uniref:hypothetical protein n=1 Tax=Nocardia sp. NPDC051832 TaxID=3155673 RepID=UPI00344AB930